MQMTSQGLRKYMQGQASYGAGSVMSNVAGSSVLSSTAGAGRSRAQGRRSEA